MLDEKLYDADEISEEGASSLCFSADESEVGERLDRYLTVKADISRSLAVKLIEDGNAEVNGKVESKNYKLRRGDVIDLTLPAPEPDEALPEDIPLDVIYEDDDIIVVNKPSGMVVHPAPSVYSGTLVNALLFHCKDSLSGIGGVIRPGIVHRIDKDTSGLLVVAKNDAAHLCLSEQLKTHDV
ncbi:MAG: RluA family pseudouridine synthase, partial [Clostridia bacterium]|nr:RluA family pseudouridine synthase [Clostridia bacterium]